MTRGSIVQKEKKIVLEELVKHKYEVLADIRIQKDIINEVLQNITRPFNNMGGGNIVPVRKFKTGIAIIDGALLGYFIIKKIRKWFKRGKR